MKLHNDVDQLIQRARIGIALNSRTAFYASLMAKHPMVADPSKKTFSTNGILIKYNPAYAKTLTLDETKGVIIHELAHIYSFHHLRRKGRDKDLWNKACDYAINWSLKKGGITLPKGVLLSERFEGMSAEMIYQILKKEQTPPAPPKPQPDPEPQGGDSSPSDDGQDNDQEDQDQGNGDQQDDPQDQQEDQDQDDDEQDDDQSQGQQDDDDDQDQDDDGQGNGQDQDDDEQDDDQEDETFDGNVGEVEDAPVQTKPERDLMEDQVRQNLAQALVMAKAQGNLPADMERKIEKLLEPTTDWSEVLHRFVFDVCHNDYSFMRPNLRYASCGFLVPSLHNLEVGSLVFVGDTSISMDKQLLNITAADMYDAAQTLNKEMIVIYADTIVQGEPQILEPDEPNFTLTPKGGGGTDFVPAFEYVEKHDLQPAALVYFTDGYCDSFPEEPDYPVLWAIYDNDEFDPPFGEVIHVDSARYQNH